MTRIEPIASNGVNLILAPRDNGYRFGVCDQIFCSRYNWLQPLFDKDGNLAAHVCADECRINDYL